MYPSQLPMSNLERNLNIPCEEYCSVRCSNPSPSKLDCFFKLCSFPTPLETSLQDERWVFCPVVAGEQEIIAALFAKTFIAPPASQEMTTRVKTLGSQVYVQFDSETDKSQ